MRTGGLTMRLLSLCTMAALAACLLATDRPAQAADDDSMERLLDAIAHVESRNDPNAVGDSGRARGVYQIHRLYWEDGTRLLGVDWPYKKVADPAKARRVVRAYLLHYGRDRDLLDLARIHNGGPHGYKKAATRPYADKIEAVLAAQLDD